MIQEPAEYDDCAVQAERLLSKTYNVNASGAERDRDTARAQVWATLAVARAIREMNGEH